MDADILHASVDKDACPTSVVAEAAELNKCAVRGVGGWVGVRVGVGGDALGVAEAAELNKCILCGWGWGWG